MFSYIVDTHHTPHYAAGYMMKQINPRAGIITHYDANLASLPILLDGIRYHWKGPLFIGTDLTVINLTKSAVWAREGVIASSADNHPHRGPASILEPEDFIDPPLPKLTREEVQEQKTRDCEIDPNQFYPANAARALTPDWPGKTENY
jgi:hypothetical protein